MKSLNLNGVYQNNFCFWSRLVFAINYLLQGPSASRKIHKSEISDNFQLFSANSESPSIHKYNQHPDIYIYKDAIPKKGTSPLYLPLDIDQRIKSSSICSLNAMVLLLVSHVLANCFISSPKRSQTCSEMHTWPYISSWAKVILELTKVQKLTYLLYLLI